MIGKNGKWTLELWHDTSFRPVFGAIGSEPILICLLNAVFIEAELPLAKEIVYVNPHQFGDSNNSRETIFDILVVDETGRQINVEMQSQSQEGYLERTICYLTRLYSSQYKTGVLYKNLKPALSISFVRFPIWDEKPDVWFERVTFAGIETARSVDALKIINVRVPREGERVQGFKTPFLRDWSDTIGHFPFLSEETLAEYEKRTPGILEARRKVESFTNAQQAAIDWARADFESRMNEHNERIFTAGVGQGRGEGGLLMLSGLVQKGKFTLSEAAEEARMTPEEFTRKVAELRRS